MTLTQNLMNTKIRKSLLMAPNTPSNLHPKILPSETRNARSAEKYSHWSHLWDVKRKKQTNAHAIGSDVVRKGITGREGDDQSAQDRAVVRWVTWPEMISHFERQVEDDPEYCRCFMIIDIRNGITSHNSTYFVIEDIVAAFSREQWTALKSNLVKTRKDLCTFLVQCLGTVFGYIFTFQKDREAAGAVHLTYHCSQCICSSTAIADVP